MDADRLGAKRESRPVDRDDLVVFDEMQDPGCDRFGIVEHRSGFRAWDQCSVASIRPIRERLGHRVQSPTVCSSEQHRIRETQDREVITIRVGSSDDGLCLSRIGVGCVIERPMGLHIADLGASSTRDPIECTDLVQHEILEGIWFDGQMSTAESEQIWETHLRPDGDLSLGSSPADGAQGRGITSMESTRHVGAADHGEHGLVIAEGPYSIGLAEIAVQVN